MKCPTCGNQIFSLGYNERGFKTIENTKYCPKCKKLYEFEITLKEAKPQ